MASGIAADFCGVLSHSTPTTEDLVEMMVGPSAGRVVKCEVGPKGLLVEAEITSAVAALKISERVYHGFGVIASMDSEGNAVIQRVALLDAPDVLGKTAKAPSWSSLRIDERFQKMSLKQIERRRIEFGKAAESNGRVIDINKQREAAQPALEMLRQFFRDNKGGNGTHPFLRSAK
jgi:hypothetical protein